MHQKVMETTLLIMENHEIVFLNFCGNPVTRAMPHAISCPYHVCIILFHTLQNIWSTCKNAIFHLTHLECVSIATVCITKCKLGAGDSLHISVFYSHF